MARHAEEIEKMIHVDFNSSIDNVPQETRHTILLYHQVLLRKSGFILYRLISFLVCDHCHKATTSVGPQGAAR